VAPWLNIHRRIALVHQGHPDNGLETLRHVRRGTSARGIRDEMVRKVYHLRLDWHAGSFYKDWYFPSYSRKIAGFIW
jgi:hypothetical protein